jgi:hypothetical protein
MKKLLQAFAIGSFVTLSLFGFAYLAVVAGHTGLSYRFYWQGKLLEGLVPCHNVGHELYPICEVTTMNIVAFYAGIPFGIVLYAIPAYLVLVLVRRRKSN